MDYIKFFRDITLEDIALVGGKNASLGQMIKDLPGKVRIPHGFAITVNAYKDFLKSVDLVPVDTIDLHEAIINAELPENIKNEILSAYKQLSAEYHQNDLSVAVRSSATAEDSAEASFAGQQESFLHIQGEEALLNATKKCMASLFTPRAIAYRKDKGFTLDQVSIAVGVQKMVNSDEASSGVMFTLETESGHQGFVTINASYGLGETVVGGHVTPDEFMVHKQKLQEGFKPLVKKVCGEKQVQACYNIKNRNIEILPVAPERQIQFSLTDSQVFELAHFAIIIEDYFSKRVGCWSPMDIEWAQDSSDNFLYIVQARPETIHTHQNKALLTTYHLQKNSEIEELVIGLSIGRKIASGRVKNIKSPQDINEFKHGDILVTHMTDPDWVPLMKKAAAIITDRGGRTCHAAIVARELNVVAVVGTGNATEVLKDGQLVTVDCSSGMKGIVYEGRIPFEVQELNPEDKEIPVKLLVNIANPDNACEISLLPIDGAGLVRLEFIIAQRIGVHPMAVAHPEKVHDDAFIRFAQQKIIGYGALQDFYKGALSEQVGFIAAALYPRPVIVRLTDFKTNEYRDLLGGSFFEPGEENPMLGFRGAARYCDIRYAPAFKLECESLKAVREAMGFDNVIVMVPFVRTIAEARATLSTLASHGLERGKNGLKIYLMVEIPANVILFEQFAEYFDGFSIGSNDLTQLTLGVDRDSGLLQHLFNENDPAVKLLISSAIAQAHRIKKPISICGQAPSDFPEFAEWLINQKIDGLSLNPDAIVPFIMKHSDS